jgi:hypothetical protein
LLRRLLKRALTWASCAAFWAIPGSRHDPDTHTSL